MKDGTRTILFIAIISSSISALLNYFNLINGYMAGVTVFNTSAILFYICKKLGISISYQKEG